VEKTGGSSCLFVHTSERHGGTRQGEDAGGLFHRNKSSGAEWCPARPLARSRCPLPIWIAPTEQQVIPRQRVIPRKSGGKMIAKVRRQRPDDFVGTHKRRRFEGVSNMDFGIYPRREHTAQTAAMDRRWVAFPLLWGQRVKNRVTIEAAMRVIERGERRLELTRDCRSLDERVASEGHEWRNRVESGPV